MAKRKRRRFTPEFKAEVVLEALRGDSSQAEFCRRHNLSDDQLSKWKQQAIEHLAAAWTSTDKHATETTDKAFQRSITRIKACSIFEMPISQRSQIMALRSRLPVADVLGRTGMLSDSSAHPRRKKFTSMTMRTFTK